MVVYIDNNPTEKIKFFYQVVDSGRVLYIFNQILIARQYTQYQVNLKKMGMRIQLEMKKDREGTFRENSIQITNVLREDLPIYNKIQK